ncbi:type VI secretion system Vgr family protein [Aquimarina sp. 2201CG14-23]|uniref:type VI secretion system Vgr family protein n=1 Tax=Aquimarina mycalae TaxID=3040073 RepID=UPI0024781D87|nr:phage baseplate assembly protein V [Aquimarina sp. 2201CG14-23]MDH7448222.1 phage baseplate assembly protein V [Aquimarina sp. 2201CG14-23]
MAADTQVQIYIGGESIPAFKSLSLHQEIDAHHSFELVCRKDVLETVTEDISGESINFLGAVFLLKIQAVNGFSNDEILEFKGVVTSINTVKGFYQKTGDLIHIHGKSCSIIADDGPHYASHKDLGISEILEKTFSGYDKGILQFNFSPKKLTPIHYSVQQEESAFQYTSRLAAQYGEWFYYNGTQLVFGKPENKDPVKLRYGYDLFELSMQLETIPNNFKYFTNDYLSDAFHEVKTKELTSSSKGVISTISQKSNQLFQKETQVFVSAHDDTQMKSRIDDQVLLQKKANEINQVKVQGKSSNPSIMVGSVITIDGDVSSSYGNYRITKVTHNCGESGRYENTFEAVTADTEIYPKTSIKAFPKSKSQTAVVVDNVDPEGMGRVKIQYAWQKETGETSPWIRQASLAGGPGQGMYFVPEKGDEVIVGHEGGNAESPIVQGSVTNASSVPESFKSGNNHLKAIKTRSGNQVTLNDADGSVTIADPSGNTIVMGGNGEITINAPNKITFSSTDIAIEASNDLTVNAGNNIASTAAKDMSSSAGTNLSMEAGTDLKAKAGSKASIKGDKSATIFGKRVSITGMIMTNIQSGAIMTIVTAGVLNITGAAKNLINGAKVKVLGGKVEIN